MDTKKADFFQPEFYRFNEDSLVLVDYVENSLKSEKSVMRCLDFCCGCGVIGIEMSNRIKIEKLYLYDVQPLYEEFLVKNIKTFSKAKANNYLFSLKELKKHNFFDLVVMNPPYFNKSSGRLPSDQSRVKARFYESGELKEIVKNTISMCQKGGRVIFCLKEDSDNMLETNFLNESKSLNVIKAKINDLTIFDITLTGDKVT